MLGMGLEERLEDADGAQPARICLVAGILGGRERQREEDGRLHVDRMRAREHLHRVAVGLDARLLRTARGIRIQQGHCLEPGPLAIGFGPDRAAAFDRGEPLLQLAARTRVETERVGPVAQGDAPLRHRAGRIGRQRLVERVDCRAELERVQERDGAVEQRLGLLRTGGGEVHRAEPLVRGGRMHVALGLQRPGDPLLGTTRRPGERWRVHGQSDEGGSERTSGD
jgi:hypothetical protein